MTTAPDRRRGFTLVELLVTLLLIAILAALTTGAVFRVLAGEKNRATEATLSKIETGLNRKWSAVLDDAAEDYRLDKMPPALVLFAGGDKDRARVLWTYMKLKNEFPTSRAEALTDFTVPTASGPVTVLRHRGVFDQLQIGGTPEQQSAACLYLSLTAAGVRGETMSLDGINQQVADINLGGTSTAKVFVDSWGQPIAFFRMAFPDEVQVSPYTRTGVTNRDPCDPQGKLLTGAPAWNTPLLTAFWTAMITGHIGAGTPPGPPATYTTPTNPTPRNWVATTVSAGPDGEWGNFFDGDNLVGYRTRREGARGD